MSESVRKTDEKIETRPFFSIVVPVYNADKFLSKCLDSLISQSFADFEVILMDDCSTDTSGKICDDYAKKDARFKVFHNEKNLKILMNRTTGIKKANGEYVVCIDNDDRLRSDCLQKIYEAIEKLGADTVLYSYSYNEDFSTNNGQLPFVENEIFERKEVLAYFCSNTRINPTWRKAFKRGILDGVDFSEYSNVLMAEDQVISCFIYEAMKKPCYINEPLYFWWQRPTNVSYSFRPDEWETQKGAAKCSIEFARKWDHEQSVTPSFESLTIKNLLHGGFYMTVFNFSAKAPNYKTSKACLKKMSHDPFFLELYAKRKPLKLSFRRRALLFMARHHLYALLRLIGNCWRLGKKR